MPLTMPLFVTPEDVILRMQLDKDLTGITDVITSGIIAAQLHVERIIDGKLQRMSQDARYFVDAESFSGIAPNGAYRLEVPSGFIREDTTIVVGASNPLAGPFDDIYTVDDTLMRIDYTRGYVHLDPVYGNCHVRIMCDTGFEPGTNPLPVTDLSTYSAGTAYAVGDQVAYNGGAYECITATTAGIAPTNAAYWSPAYIPQESLPMPIYEAIMSLVPMVFNSNQTTNRSDEAQKQYRTATDHAEMLLQPYVRTKGFTFRAA